FTLWAGNLGLTWPVVFGRLFFIESLPSAVVSFTEGWRLSNLGFTVGLLMGGFGLPLVPGLRRGVLLGASVFVGSSASAAGLMWLRRRQGPCPSQCRSLRPATVRDPLRSSNPGRETHRPVPHPEGALPPCGSPSMGIDGAPSYWGH